MNKLLLSLTLGLLAHTNVRGGVGGAEANYRGGGIGRGMGGSCNFGGSVGTNG